MLEIKPSPTADTRTCDASQVSLDQLGESSHQHIRDVNKAIHLFAERLLEAGIDHDHDKVSREGLPWFHNDFITGFAQAGWWGNHKRVNRHHLTEADGVPDDVNLLDVLEHIADCVMSGLARSGKVYPLKLSDALLQQAFQNTVALLESQVRVVGAEDQPSQPQQGDA